MVRHLQGHSAALYGKKATELSDDTVRVSTASLKQSQVTFVLITR